MNANVVVELPSSARVVKDLTDNGVVVGDADSGASSTAAGTNGQLLVGQTGAAPAFKTISGDLSIDADGVATVTGAVAEKLALGAAVSKTIATGTFAVTAAQRHLKVLGEGGTDDFLDAITGLSEGDVIFLRASDDAQTISIRDASVSGATTGGFRTPGAATLALAEDEDYAFGIYDGAKIEIIGYRTQAADIGTARLASQAVTKAKSALFVSSETTCTGAEQTVAHSLGGVPAWVLIVPTEHPGTPDTGAFDIAEGSHDGTNVVFTGTLNLKVKILASL